MRPNWELKHCCNHEQVVFLITVSVCTVVILALWRTILLRPFKLVTVFLHEASHAIVCKLTCGKCSTALMCSSTFDERSLGLSESSSNEPPPIWKLYFKQYGFCIPAWCFSLVSWRGRLSHMVEGIQVHADEGGTTQTRGGVYWLILPAGYLGSSFWGMLLILASTNLLTARIAAGCFLAALIIVLFVAKNWTLRGLCIGFIVFLGVIWALQETTKVRVLRYIILFIGVMNSLFSVYDIYDDLISRRVHSSDAEKFAEVCPCPCNGVGWGVIWGLISFVFLCGAMYLGLVILS